MILEFIERLAEEAKNRGLEFLIIGGHAVIHHGYARMTTDIDFLIPENQLVLWRDLMAVFRYQPYNHTSAFVQFSSGTLGWPRVDLMLVNEETWSKLWSQSENKKNLGVDIRVPSPQHLIALKLHAARSESRDQLGKDWTDIEEIVRLHKLDPSEEDFAQMILVYGGEESLARLKKLWQRLQDSHSL